MFLIGGFILGFAGSLHCIGMCGPIVLALPWQSKSGLKVLLKRILYFLSKSTSYLFLGIITGLIGDTFRFFGAQQSLSIMSGTVMLILGLVSLFRFTLTQRITFFDKFFIKLRSLFSSFLQTERISSFLVVGFLNGLLPCGFVYIGLGTALSGNSVIESGLFMFLFGLGTIPALLVVALLPSVLKSRWKIPTAKLAPILSIVFALMLILRGLNLGIPFVSPKMHTTQPAHTPNPQIDCCK